MGTRWPRYTHGDDRCPHYAATLADDVRWLDTDETGTNTWQCCTTWHTSPRR